VQKSFHVYRGYRTRVQLLLLLLFDQPSRHMRNKGPPETVRKLSVLILLFTARRVEYESSCFYLFIFF